MEQVSCGLLCYFELSSSSDRPVLYWLVYQSYIQKVLCSIPTTVTKRNTKIIKTNISA
jgi:hypothetical protein